jgi:hypothetical protein
MGKTTISWNTGDESAGKVCVSANGGQEFLFAAARLRADYRRLHGDTGGTLGSAAAPWIRTGCRYDFRLYNSDHTELLAKVTVNRAAQ